MSAKRKTVQHESDEQIELIEELYRSAEKRLEAGTLRRLAQPSPLTCEERSIIEDFVFVCRRLPARALIIRDLQTLTARYAGILIREESPQ